MPDLSDDQINRLRRAAARIDQPQPPVGRSGWNWFPDKLDRDQDGHRWVLFGTTIVYDTPERDPVDFDLSVMREERPRVRVEVSIAVDCWCDHEHSTHEIRAQSWLAGHAESFTETFESAAEVLASWTSGRHTASVYRAAACLPPPPDRRHFSSHDRS
ncbi:hypothetical protein [Nocardia ninae]|nr:hypothetical protein [Nocardia ninae]